MALNLGMVYGIGLPHCRKSQGKLLRSSLLCQKKLASDHPFRKRFVASLAKVVAMEGPLFNGVQQ